MSARVTRSEACFVLSEAVPRAFRAQELRNPGRTFYRKRPGQTSLTVTVALDKKDIPTGTVAGMAKHCGMTLADFCTMLGIDL